MHSSVFFRIKLIARLILKREISGSHTISDQSLLLSTNVLNDILDILLIVIPCSHAAWKYKVIPLETTTCMTAHAHSAVVYCNSLLYKV